VVSVVITQYIAVINMVVSLAVIKEQSSGVQLQSNQVPVK
jgi:hypothetical protein